VSRRKVRRLNIRVCGPEVPHGRVKHCATLIRGDHADLGGVEADVRSHPSRMRPPSISQDSGDEPIYDQAGTVPLNQKERREGGKGREAARARCARVGYIWDTSPAVTT
jgi:hypothetical protein